MDVAEGTTFTAEVDREDGWWTIHVVELDVVTQAAHWSEVEDTACGVIVAMLDLEEGAPVDLELVPVFDDEAGRLLQAAREWETRAHELVASASEAKRTAVQTLKEAGWTLQSIAVGIGLSYQRVEQLLKEGGNAPSAHAQPKKITAVKRFATSGRHVTSTAATTGLPRTSARSRSAVTGRFVTKSTAARNATGHR